MSQVVDVLAKLTNEELVDLRVALAQGRYSVIPKAICWDKHNVGEVARLCESVATDLLIKREMGIQ